MKAVVVAGGDAEAADASELGDAELVIAADGGSEWLAAVERIPDMLIGDLDSVEPRLVARLAQAGVLVERHPVDKEATDAEMALDRAVAAGADRVVVLGALFGRRLDHAVANLLLLADPEWAGRADLRLVRGGTLVRALHGPGSLQLEGAVGTTVSLLPVGGDAVGVRTAGLQFALDGETLGFGRSRGISNRVDAAQASVSLEHGVLLVIESSTKGGSE